MLLLIVSRFFLKLNRLLVKFSFWLSSIPIWLNNISFNYPIILWLFSTYQYTFPIRSPKLLMHISAAFIFTTEFDASLKKIDRKRSRYCQDKHLTYTIPSLSIALSILYVQGVAICKKKYTFTSSCKNTGAWKQTNYDSKLYHW